MQKSFNQKFKYYKNAQRFQRFPSLQTQNKARTENVVKVNKKGFTQQFLREKKGSPKRFSDIGKAFVRREL